MFYGRFSEIKYLQDSFREDKAVITAVYGRRRVGKTALVMKSFEETPLYFFDGLEGVASAGQLRHFVRQYREQFPAHSSEATPGSWEEALLALCAALKTLKNRRCVVFFDEFQWMAVMRSSLVSLLKSVWDRHLSKIPGLQIVLCGSISSFMVRKVLRSKALYGRVERELRVDPLPLREAREFFKGGILDNFLLEIAMTLGGIPFYLSLLDPNRSWAQNLQDLAFRPGGVLLNEFHRIFVSHFGKGAEYEAIVRCLRKESRSASQIAHQLGISTGGRLTTRLENLALAGFVERFSPLDASPRSSLTKYRILDEYSHFFLTRLEPARRAIEQGQFPKFISPPSNQLAQWQGYAFERLCRRNAFRIAEALGFGGVQHVHGSWYRRHSPGAQVDLLFKRADRVLTVIEAKYRTSLSSTDISRSFETKVAALRKAYPRYGIQRVVLVPRMSTVAKSVEGLVDRVLIAEEVF